MSEQKNKPVNRDEKKPTTLRLQGFEAMEPRCLLSVNPAVSEISGTVFHDANNDGIQSASEVGIANVLITLADQNGGPVSVALTDANGDYAFRQLPPGVYSIVQTQPVGWTDNDILNATSPSSDTPYGFSRQVKLVSDAHASDIDFAEFRAASIAGSIMQSDTVEDCNDQIALSPVSDAMIQLQDEGGAVVKSTKTDANGNYRIGDIAPGRYQIVHTQTSEEALSKLEIRAESGQDYAAYDFCQPATPDLNGFDTEAPPPVEIHQGDVAVSPSSPGTPIIVASRSNLSLAFQPVLADPMPRTSPTLNFDYSDSLLVDLTPPLAQYSVQPIPGIATTFTPSLWRLVLVDLDTATTEEDESTSPVRTATFQATRLNDTQVPDSGLRIPVSGDFDGDGTDELGFYVGGDWFIDLNHNDRWDSDDVWIRLGNARSTPLTGDWDGDGKCDLGIFEGKRINRSSVIARSIDNPSEHQVDRLAKSKAPQLGTQAVDRVFQFGKATHQPVVGDWDGNGVATIGVFIDGIWQLDVDGNGSWNQNDVKVEFGKSGDVAFVGDFNGDGKTDLAILRNGVLIVDSNGNRQLDSSDQRIAVKGGGAEMVVGDFNGDGRDEVRMAANDLLRRAG